MAAEAGLPGWSDEEVRSLLAEARAEARDQVKAVVREALARSLAGRVEALTRRPAVPAGKPEAGEPPPTAAAPANPAPAKPEPARAATGTQGEAPATAERAGTTERPPGDERAAPPTAAPAAAPAAWLVYVYAVMAAADLPPTAGIEPVGGGGAVTGIEHGGLAAVASQVPASEYDARALRRGLEDRGWLERVALAHERVLAALLPRALVPFRLCSVFSAPGKVVELLDKRGEDLRRALRHVEGRVELGVKILAEPAALRRAAAGPGTSPGAGPGTPPAAGEGAAYLAKRRRRRDTEGHARELGRRLAASIHARLAGLAVDAVRGKPQARALTGDHRWMLLNGSYLVASTSEEAFAAEVARLGRRFEPAGVRVALTGPWAPYNFTRIDASDAGEGVARDRAGP